MFQAMYEWRDAYGHWYHISARMGGFKTREAATRAVIRKGRCGYVADASNRPLFIIRNGKVCS